MQNASYVSLLEALTESLVCARVSNEPGFIWHIPGRGWEHGPAIPAEEIYLRVLPTGEVHLFCDTCERASATHER